MNKISIFELTEHALLNDLVGKIAVVIDVLRATSSITTAMYNGCKAVYPVCTVDEAFALKSKLGSETLLCGERGGLKVDGFDCGNSPFEYMDVKGKKIVLTTTNGTKALLKAGTAETVYVLSFLNFDAVLDKIKDTDCDIVILCSGTEGQPTFEDSACAAMLAKQLNKKIELKVCETTELLFEKIKPYKSIIDVLKASHHGKNLVKLGFEKDLEFCSQTGLYDIVPIYQDEKITL